MKRKIFKKIAAIATIMFAMLTLVLAAGCSIHGCVSPAQGFTSEPPFVYTMNGGTRSIIIPFDIREQFSEINLCQDGLEWTATDWSSANTPQRYFMHNMQKYYILDNSESVVLLSDVLDVPVVRIYRGAIGSSAHIGSFVMEAVRNDSSVRLQNHFLYSNFLYYHIRESYTVTTWFTPDATMGVGTAFFARHSFRRLHLVSGESEQVDIEHFFDKLNPIFAAHRPYYPHGEPEQPHPTLFINPSFA